MSPVSRNRKKKQNRSRDARRAEHEPSPYAPILKQAQSVHDARSSVDAELWAASFVGAMFLEAQRDEEEDIDTVMDDFHAGVIEYLAGKQTPAALAALRAFSLVGDGSARELARAGAARMSELGVADPGWFSRSEPLEPLDAWHVGDPFGESEVIMVGFRRPEGDHALFALVDRVSDQGLVQLELMGIGPGGVRELMEAYRTTEGLTEPMPLPLAQARARLDLALETYLNFAPLPDEDDEDDEADPANTWPVLVPRLELLPEEPEQELEEPDEALLAETVDSFLASPHAASLPNRELARAWAFSAVDWAVERGWEPVWFGPQGLAEQLLEQAEDEHVSVAEQDMPALEAAVRAWAHFTADARGLPSEIHQSWDSVLPEIWTEFRRAYDDPDVAEHRQTCEDVVALGDYLRTREEQSNLRKALALASDPQGSLTRD